MSLTQHEFNSVITAIHVIYKSTPMESAHDFNTAYSPFVFVLRDYVLAMDVHKVNKWIETAFGRPFADFMAAEWDKIIDWDKQLANIARRH